MKALVMALLGLTLASHASAATIVLDPGPGTDYLGVWCGGQSVNEYAQGFDAANYAVTAVKVTTSSHGSGRGSPNHYYIACWAVTFFPNGAIQSRSPINSGSWIQGNPAVSCNATLDPVAVFESQAPSGDVLATLSTALVGTEERAVLDAASPADADPPAITIDTPGDGAVFTLNQNAVASYACSDPDGVFSCDGPVPNGGALDTSTLGAHAFTVTAQDALGNAGSLTQVYQVATECSDGIDNDGDGGIDAAVNTGEDQPPPLVPPDPGCRDASETSTESPACQDGIDNDGDGGIDFDGGALANGGVPLAPPDPACTSPHRDDETSAPVCGLGAELALAMPVLSLAMRRRRRAS
jgi:hypothetical protein